MKRIGLVFGMTVVGAMAGLMAAAADFHWIGDASSSWRQKSSYQEDAVPGAGDTVIVGDMKAASHPDWAATVNDADFDLVSSLAAVKLGIHAVVTFDVTGEKTVACPVVSQRGSGRSDDITLVKAGSGVLTLGAEGAKDYYVSLDVREGVLHGGVSGRMILDLNVAENASFVLPSDGGITLAGTWIAGKGLITNETAEVTKTIMINDVKGTFGGTVGGDVAFQFGGAASYGPYCADIRFSGVDSTYSGQNTIYNSTLGAKKIGMKGEPSSLGTQSEIMVKGTGAEGALVCLGEEPQETDKSVQLGYAGFPFTFDAGTYGGVTFRGKWWFTGSNRQQHVLCLSGSNTVNEAVLAGAFDEPYYLDSNKDYFYNYSTYLRKTGPGIWRLAGSSGCKLRGTVAVEEGTLRFDSVSEAGTICSLGLSTLPTAGNAGATAAEAGIVPYAIALGGESTEGTFEYTGVEDAVCSTRPIAVKGPARLRNATDRDFAWANVFGLGDGDKTLTLDGDSLTAKNSLSVVTNASGKLSIAKVGKGLWTLDGAVPNGSIDVREGTLVLHRKPVVPTWYRLTVKQNYMESLGKQAFEDAGYGKNYGASWSRSFLLEEFALYDAEGNRLNKNFAYVKDEGVYTYLPITKLQPGEIAMDQGSLGNAARTPANLCDGKKANNGWNGSSDTSQLGSSDYLRPITPKAWVSVVMRLPEGSPLVAAYDYANEDCQANAANTRARQLYAYTLEGSVDGENWTELTNVVGAAENVTACTWVSDGTALSNNARPGCGYPLDSRLSHDTVLSTLEDAETVSVASGATLKAEADSGTVMTIKDLTVDPEKGAGTIDGFAFAETGTFNLTKLPRSGSKYKFTLKNCTGFENVANWSVLLDGQPTARYEFSADGDGSITIWRSGMCIILK